MAAREVDDTTQGKLGAECTTELAASSSRPSRDTRDGWTRIRILDGGLGTTLEDKYGVRFSGATPLWAAHVVHDDPETLSRCQREFVEAGIDVVETATYQLSLAGCERTPNKNIPGEQLKLDGMRSVFKEAVAIARHAVSEAGSEASVALSLGPYGACMTPSQEYSGRYDAEHDSLDALFRWHSERLWCWAEVPDLARVDCVAYETIPRLDEIVAIRRVLSTTNWNKLRERHRTTSRPAERVVDLPPYEQPPYWISCMFPLEEPTLPTGESVANTVRAMLGAEHSDTRPICIGMNCVKIGRVEGLVDEYEAAVSDMIASGEIDRRPQLVLYPDGTNGEVYNTTTQQWELPPGQAPPEMPWADQLAQIVKRIALRGKWDGILVGGCCKSTPKDIRALARTVREYAPDGFLKKAENFC